MTVPIPHSASQLPEELWPGGLLGTGQPVGDPMPLGIAFAMVLAPSLLYFLAVFPVPFMVLPKARPWHILHCLWILVIGVGTIVAVGEWVHQRLGRGNRDRWHDGCVSGGFCCYPIWGSAGDPLG